MPIDLLRAQREFRERFNRGGRGIEARVTSFWRSTDRNRAVGGAARSQHLYGLAADVVPRRADWQRAKRAWQGEDLVVIDEGDHLHVQRFPAGAIAAGVVGPLTAFEVPGGTAWRYRM